MESIYPQLPQEIKDQLSALALRIVAARKRRRIRQSDMATRAGISMTALRAVERGEPTTGLGNYLRVLWAMGLNRELDLVAEPGLDRDGLALEFDAQAKRVGVARKIDNAF